MRSPTKISGYKSDIINEIIDYSEAITVQSSSDHRVEYTTRGIFLHNINKPEGGEQFDYSRFRLDIKDNLTAVVKAGVYTCNGLRLTDFESTDTEITGEGDSDEGFADDFISAVTAPTVYFYLEKTHATKDPTTIPSGLKIVCSTELPSEGYMRQKYWLLGQCDTALDDEENAILLPATLIRYWIGDIDELTIVPDGKLNPRLPHPIRTMDFREDSEGELMIYDADAALIEGVGWTSKSGIPVLPKDANGGGSIVWHGWDTVISATQKSIELGATGFQLYDMDGDSGEMEDGWDFCMRDSAGGILKWVDQGDITVGNAEHADDADTADSATTAATADYANDGAWPTSHHALENWSTAGATNADHDPRYWQKDDATEEDDFKTTGEVHGGSFHLSASPDDNFWSGADFEVSVSSSIALDASESIDISGEDISIDATSGIAIGKVETSQIDFGNSGAPINMKYSGWSINSEIVDLVKKEDLVNGDRVLCIKKAI